MTDKHSFKITEEQKVFIDGKELKDLGRCEVHIKLEPLSSQKKLILEFNDFESLEFSEEKEEQDKGSPALGSVVDTF